MPVPTKNLIRTVRVTDRTGLGSANEGQRKDRRRAFREVDGVWCEYSADAEQELGTTHAAFLHASEHGVEWFEELKARVPTGN